MISEVRRVHASMTKRAVLPFLAAMLLPACATDSLPEPEPTIVTPGAFIAEDATDGPIALLRTLDTFESEDDTVLALTEYDVTPSSFEEATFLARMPDLPVRFNLTAASAKLLSQTDHRVVWYRTLTDEERKRAE
jgi:hypothetical protein